MASRVAFALAAALAGCDASLGSGTAIDAPSADGRRVDAGMADAAADARVCAGGNAAAMAPDNSCLVFVTTKITYVEAKAACAALQPGGHLAYLKNAALDTFAETFIGTVDTWIGGNDLVTENAFMWDDGAAFAFDNWHANEPNNGGTSGTQEDCVIIAGSRTGKQWDDRPCDATQVPTSGNFAYLCQY